MIYVDDMQARMGRMTMCHMLADTPSELRQMAVSLGINLRWIQYEGTYKEHFDICLSKRQKAIALGAQTITKRQSGALIVARRARHQGTSSDIAITGNSNPD